MRDRHANRICRLQCKLLLPDRSCPQGPRHAAKAALFIAILLLALAGCGPPPDSVAEQLGKTVNAQDLDGALRLFARDAVVDAGDSGSFGGKGEIQRWLERLFADNVVLEQVGTLAETENEVRARYKVTTDSASALGVAYLEGVGEVTVQEGRITALSFDLSQESRAELLRATLEVGSPPEVGTPLLSYAVLTDPDPLRASPGGGYEPNFASLWVVVTNNTADAVRVRSITLNLLPECDSPECDGAGDLTPNISGVETEAPRYWYRTKPKRLVHWHITPTVEGPFIIEPELLQDGVLEAGDGLSFPLSHIQVSDKPGVSHLEIVEETGDGTQGSMTIQLAKFPWELYVSDLGAWPLVVESGGSTTLYWEGSDGATYYLYDGKVTAVITEGLTHTVGSLTQTTTFYLTATLVGGEGLPPVIRERTVTVGP